MNRRIGRISALLIAGACAAPWYASAEAQTGALGVPLWALQSLAVTAVAGALIIWILADDLH